MKTLAGVLPVDRRAHLASAARTSPAATPRSGCSPGSSSCPKAGSSFPDLSVHENLRLGAVNRRARAGWRGALDEVHAIFPKLLERRHQAAATLSGGEQQMLAIGRGLMARPSLMLLDEPTLGLAPVMALQMFELIRTLAASITLLVAEQDVRRTLDVARRAYVIENGRVALAGRRRRTGGGSEDPPGLPGPLSRPPCTSIAFPEPRRSPSTSLATAAANSCSSCTASAATAATGARSCRRSPGASLAPPGTRAATATATTTKARSPSTTSSPTCCACSTTSASPRDTCWACRWAGGSPCAPRCSTPTGWRR